MTGCYECGLPYSSAGWIDAVVADEVWLKISPTGDEGGLLCITCMARRLVISGINGVGVSLNSGPFSFAMTNGKPPA